MRAKGGIRGLFFEFCAHFPVKLAQYPPLRGVFFFVFLPFSPVFSVFFNQQADSTLGQGGERAFFASTRRIHHFRL